MYELRYLLMRITRLVLAMWFEISMFAGVLFGLAIFAIGLDSINRFIYDYDRYMWLIRQQYTYPMRFFMEHPFISSAVLLGSVPISFMLCMAFGTPYKYRNRPPGLSFVVCGSCHEETPNFSRCVNCNARNSKWFGSIITLALNTVLSVVWAIHDGIFTLIFILA